MTVHRVIHKYNLLSSPVVAPRGDVRLVAYQGNGSELPTIWIEHTIGGGDQHRYFIRATGEEFPEGDEFVGSAICGRYVWHVFRRAVQ